MPVADSNKVPAKLKRDITIDNGVELGGLLKLATVNIVKVFEVPVIETWRVAVLLVIEHVVTAPVGVLRMHLVWVVVAVNDAGEGTESVK